MITLDLQTELNDATRRDVKMAELSRLLYISALMNRPYEQGTPYVGLRMRGEVQGDIDRLVDDLWPGIPALLGEERG